MFRPLLIASLLSISNAYAFIVSPAIDSYPVQGQGEQSNKYGYVNHHGQWVIQPRFDEADQFQNGYARVRIGERWGVIDQQGMAQIPVQHPMVHLKPDGKVVVPKRLVQGRLRNVGVFHSSGKLLFAQKYDATNAIGGGVWGLKTRNSYQLGYQQSGKILPTPYQNVNGSPSGWALGKHAAYRLSQTADKAAFNWDILSPMGTVNGTFSAKYVRSYNGYCAVAEHKATQTFVIRRDGAHVITRAPVTRVGTPHVSSSGQVYFYAMTKGRKVGFMNKHCHWKTPPVFQQMGNLNGDLVAVKYRDKWGYVVAGKGTWSIKPTFQRAQSFEPHRQGAVAFAKENGSWGLINAQGKWLGNERFKYVMPFNGDDVAVVVSVDSRGQELHGYLNRQGKWHLQPAFEHATAFKHGYATVTVEGSDWLINRRGQKVKCLTGKCRDMESVPTAAEHIR